MAGAKAPTIAASGSPSEPVLQNAVTTINEIFKTSPPDIYNLSSQQIAALRGAYNDISNYLAVAKASGNQKKVEMAEHYMQKLNLPRSDSSSKLVFLEGRLNNVGIATNSRASNFFADIIQSGINQLSDTAQKAKAMRQA
jgi:hypothetical protein